MVLSEQDRQLVELIQHGLPLDPHPYAVIGRRLGISESRVIERIAQLQQEGTIRRMGVVVRHRSLGYRANAMVVWDVPDGDVERIGRLLAEEDCVTLCYQRPRHQPDWPYNLFCMIHGRERDSVLRRIGLIIAAHGLEAIAHEVLFSCRAFKQRGARYVPRHGEKQSPGVMHG